MCAKTTARLDGVVVDDAQRTKLDVFGIVVIRKGKAVPGIQLPVISMAPFPGAT
ncbi:hypothetical protein [Nitrosovibrio tenuis]|uniref:hypothetical protein n=1 Tax=Nitrosovibrio tenuis TaxID=1233 RepID=UPI00318352EC